MTNKNPLKSLQNDYQSFLNLIKLDIRKLTIPDIVSMYYKAISLKSSIMFLKKQSPHLQTDLTKIRISLLENFDNDVHPKVLLYVTQQIDNMMKNLDTITSKSNYQQSYNEKFEKLRKLMSTREFVEQYDKGLRNA